MARNVSWPSPGGAPDRIHRARREDEPAVRHGGGADVRTPDKIKRALDEISEEFHRPVISG